MSVQAATKWHGVERVRNQARLGRRGEEALQRLIGVGHERVDVDECLDIGIARRGVRDDEPAVGMGDQDDRARDRLQEAGQVRSVDGRPAELVRRRDDLIALAL